MASTEEASPGRPALAAALRTLAVPRGRGLRRRGRSRAGAVPSPAPGKLLPAAYRGRSCLSGSSLRRCERPAPAAAPRPRPGPPLRAPRASAAPCRCSRARCGRAARRPQRARAERRAPAPHSPPPAFLGRRRASSRARPLLPGLPPVPGGPRPPAECMRLTLLCCTWREERMGEEGARGWRGGREGELREPEGPWLTGGRAPASRGRACPSQACRPLLVTLPPSSPCLGPGLEGAHFSHFPTPQHPISQSTAVPAPGWVPNALSHPPGKGGCLGEPNRCHPGCESQTCVCWALRPSAVANTLGLSFPTVQFRTKQLLTWAGRA